jgi:heat shock protein HslJ
MSSRRRALILLCLSAGCDEVGSPLDGRSFLLSSAQGYTPVTGTTFRLSFEDGELGASTGCNGMGGPYQVRDGVLAVSELASTLKGCDPALEQQDQFVRELLTSQPKLALEANELTLTGSNATFVFLDREVADPDRPLIGTVWSIDTFIEGDHAVSHARLTPPTLTFSADGTFTVQGPCNTLAGKYDVNGRIALSEVGVTQAACPEAGSVESHLLAVFALGASLTYEIEADKLRLLDGGKGVMADAP